LFMAPGIRILIVAAAHAEIFAQSSRAEVDKQAQRVRVILPLLGTNMHLEMRLPFSWRQASASS
ncbi:hypothetical protein CP993_25720, partial [Escherichia coli]